MSGRSESAWQRATRGRVMPTYRQVDYWTRNGGLDDDQTDRRSPGSGHYRDWSEHELDKLSALGYAVRDAYQAGFQGLPMPVVRRLWELLDQAPAAILRFGGIAITATIPNKEES